MHKKVGLALSSGAARGLAHIGVLAGLKDHDIHIDMITGTSMGAFIAAMYARGEEVEGIKRVVSDLGQKRLSLLFDPVLPRSSLIRGRKMAEEVRSAIGDIRFSELNIPFACSATDLAQGRTVVIDEGPVWEAVMASISIPILLPPVRLKRHLLVDGGITNPIPVATLKDMGADVVIAVDTVSRENALGDMIFDGNSKPPNIFNIAFQTINLVGCQALKNSVVDADIVIKPRVNQIGWIDFKSIDDCIAEGRLALEKSIDRING
ncbi:putative esterase of the alpha-beta hydrolase superfamily [Dehalogenimonas alkenigignens]|uniref:Putative esterase of the alpha-beta hydrolase superfamily n=1 Tax=Dehalogenimonas alkenigignens TaxID=1217799 RepID=A0A0W0GGZ7_9CHLR|nr:patatin-like phospholipase family protein [Dehalogenimonas alkenigignens]KTB47823.1 putative esterase of the alpha-beta hydrolase superfamily [Dehalogenimonas alkenigignens]